MYNKYELLKTLCAICDKLSCECDKLGCTRFTYLPTDLQYVCTFFNNNFNNDNNSSIIHNIIKLFYAYSDKMLRCVKSDAFGQNAQLIQVKTKNITISKLTTNVPDLDVFISFDLLNKTFIKIDEYNVDLTKMVYPYFNHKQTKGLNNKHMCTSVIKAQTNSESVLQLQSNIIKNSEIYTRKSLSISTCHSSKISSNLYEETFGLNKSGLNIGHLNIQHIMNKLDTVKILTNQLHIFGLCETFLSDVVSDAELQIYNFKIERKDRQNKRGGGLLLYIHENVPYKRRIELENNQIESVWIEVRFPNSKSFLLNFSYRPPSSLQSWIDSYEIQISNALIENDDIYMLGDFNLDYNTHNYGNNKWSNMTVTYGLTQMITVPTRITKFSSTTIDHIYTTYPENVSKTNVPCISLSDHYPICFTRIIKQTNQKSLNKHKYMKYRYFKKFNEEKFNNDLIMSDLQNVEHIENPNEALSTLYTIMNHILEIHAPIKSKRIKREIQPEWYSQDILNASKHRNMYHKQKNWAQYKKWRNKTSYLIRKNKRNFYNKAIKETQNSSKIWKHIKTVTCQENNGVSLPPQLCLSNDKILDDPQKIVNEFNKHFLHVANIIERIPFDTEYFHCIKQNIDIKLKHVKFSIDIITPFEVKQIIDKLNLNKSTGLDGIGPRIIKCARDHLVIPITSLINRSIQQGIFPQKLKEAYVLPLFKSGSRDDPNNYRPISILPTISKIFERHVANQLHSYFEKTDILYTYQSGFRKNHSCQTSLIALIDKWLKQMDNGQLVGTIFIDLKKAFDMVDHNILIEKLRLYHFDKLTISWFSSYLANRNQIVKVGNTISSAGIVKYGVPQGSILGPLLFLLYINDLPMIIKHAELDIYADDSTLHTADTHISNIETKLQTDFNFILTWCEKNNMSINPTKTTTMLIHNTR